ncbi:MAG: hypothetical protein U0S36_04320 [Candidatus Nanopelagicales bacterium]
MSVVVLMSGYVWEISALYVLGWILLGLWIIGVLARAVTIEVLAAIADGESPRDGLWRFVWLVVVAALVGLIPMP